MLFMAFLRCRPQETGQNVMHEPVGLNILDITTLPTLPQTLVELIDACNRKDVNIQELGTIVARDVSVSTRVLQLVNSAFIGARATFSDIVQAVIYLGVDTTRNLAISVAVHETFKSMDMDEAINLSDFWYHSFLTAVLAKSLAQAVGVADLSEAYLTGLLHDVGKLLLLKSFPDQYREILREKQSVDLEFRERESLGITHSEAAALLVGSWHLQPEIADAIAGHHRRFSRIMEESPLAKILLCADRLSHCAWPDIRSVADIVCTLIAIDQETLLDCTKDSLALACEIAGHMGITVSKGPASGKDTASMSRQAEEALADRVLTFSRINGFLDNMVKAENLDRVFQVVEESLSILCPLQGCLFLLPDGIKGQLAVNGSAGNPLYRKAKDLRIHADETKMISSCLEHLRMLDSLTFSAENDLATGDQFLLDIFGTGCLVAVPVIIAGHEPGCIIIGLAPADVGGLQDRERSLLLLAGHTGMRCRLEKTYRKHAEELAATRVEAAAEIARSIAHEISNPIAVLQNYLAVLGLKLDNHSELVADLEIIGREIGRIGDISNQLRDLSGQVKAPATEPVDLRVLISDVLAFFRQSLADGQGIDLCLILQDGLPEVQSNGTKIRQILGNLIKNAIEAIEGKGVIRVTAEKVTASAGAPPGVKISVEDNGPGVLLPHIEDVFHAGTTTKKDGHAGLGLAIVRKLAGELCGTATCSKKQHGGMIFILTLPG
jgi:putative nucleotidyltransferase with HDIG domain